MEVFSAFLCVLMIFCGINKSVGLPQGANITLKEDESADEFVFSVEPLKIILEHQLQNVKASKRSNSPYTKPEESDKNLKLLSKTPAKNICTEAEIRKKASPEEISKIFSGDIKEDEAHLQKIYDSVKECQFVKVRTSKLWGPLWHCLNRLFLFFVFG